MLILRKGAGSRTELAPAGPLFSVGLVGRPRVVIALQFHQEGLEQGVQSRSQNGVARLFEKSLGQEVEGRDNLAPDL